MIGQPVQHVAHLGHYITVPPMGGIPPYCSCGYVGGNGHDKPLLADHVRDVVTERLEYMRDQMEDECMSWGELGELQGFGEAGLIPEWDVQLREAAGLPEFPDVNA